MSNLQGSYTNSDTYNIRATNGGEGMYIPDKCIICGQPNHRGKGGAECSRAKQKLYAAERAGHEI